MKHQPAILSVAILLAAGGGWYAWYAAQPNQPAPAAAGNTPAISITSALVQRQTVPVQLEATGNVTSLNSVDIRPQVSNLVSQVHIREGQSVKAGDLLFTLDERSDRVNLQKAEAQLARDRASLADLERQNARSKELRQKGFIAQSAADTVQSQLDAQQAAVRAAQAALEGARVTLGFNRLHAPFSGRTGAIAVRPGSLVQANVTTLVTLTQLDPIEIAFTLPERELNALLAARQKGDIRVNARLPGSQGKEWQAQGKLSFIDNTVDTQSGSIRLKALFANADHALWPGAYAGIRITLRELPDANVIPLTAVVNAVDGTHVYSIGADQRVQRRKIEVLHRFGVQAAIKGLDSGERIVVDGTQNLRPGASVREAGKSGDAKP